VVECSPDTWEGLRLDTLPADEGLRLLERIFQQALEGGRFFGPSGAEPPRWQRFRHVTNGTWCHGNVVLMGDAAHAAHFSVASGTRQALKDAVSLADALREQPDLPRALRRYEEQRREATDRVVASGRRRAERWEHREGLLELDVLDFVHAKNGRPDAELRRRRPLYRAQQLRVVRMARRQVGAARRRRHALETWAGGDGRTAAPAPERAGPAGTGS
jgi:2-polyprenyl-6-methoxyphenol hydroxylase-like FAD-dependent oxidoreductase